MVCFLAKWRPQKASAPLTSSRVQLADVRAELHPAALGPTLSTHGLTRVSSRHKRSFCCSALRGLAANDVDVFSDSSSSVACSLQKLRLVRTSQRLAQHIGPPNVFWIHDHGGALSHYNTCFLRVSTRLQRSIERSTAGSTIPCEAHV